MKASIKDIPMVFTPKEVTLTIESPEEWYALSELGNWSGSSAKTVKKLNCMVDERVLEEMLVTLWRAVTKN